LTTNQYKTLTHNNNTLIEVQLPCLTYKVYLSAQTTNKLLFVCTNDKQTTIWCTFTAIFRQTCKIQTRTINI